MTKETCYMCDLPATSREHVPPKCFFPKQKEYGKNLKTNLITVPSCELHNSLKANDDEFFRSVVVMNAGINDAGMYQFHGPFLRAAKRTPEAYKKLFKDKGTAAQDASRALEFDRPRLDKSIDRLARALYLHNFRRKWTLPISILLPQVFASVKADEAVADELTSNMVEMIWKFLGEHPTLGKNQEVFKYRIKHETNGNAFVLACIIYEKFEVFTYSSEGLIKNAA